MSQTLGRTLDYYKSAQDISKTNSAIRPALNHILEGIYKNCPFIELKRKDYVDHIDLDHLKSSNFIVPSRR